jgi:putative transposase
LALKHLSQKEQHLKTQVLKLKSLIANLTIELKKRVRVALNNRFPCGIRDTRFQQLKLISDNSCQPTNNRFRFNFSHAGIKKLFTTWSNLKGNADTGRFMRTIKKDFIWIDERDNELLSNVVFRFVRVTFQKSVHYAA